MKKVFYTALILAGMCQLTACNNGDYQANPASPANNAVNPLNPLKPSDYSWSGDKPFSCDINGTHWKTSDVEWFLDTTGANVVVANDGKRIMYFRLSDVWTGNSYDMGYNNAKRYAYMLDSTGANHSLAVYRSDIDNSGGISIIENDSAYLKAKFYYKGYDGLGTEVWISNGYMEIRKP